MSRIRKTNTKPELALRRALWAEGIRGWRCHWRGPSGSIDIAFTRWRLAVQVDGSFWHGHPSKWQPDRWKGYWDDKIKRNIARDRQQEASLAAAGWKVVRFWDFEVEHDATAVARVVIRELEALRKHGSLGSEIVGTRPDGASTRPVSGAVIRIHPCLPPT